MRRPPSAPKPRWAWQPLRRLGNATVHTSAFLVALAGLPGAARATDEAATAGDLDRAQRGAPGIAFGGGVGYANHFGRTVQVDAVTGASTPSKSYSKSGVAMNAFADVAAVNLGPGNLGLTTAFTLALPTTFMNLSLQPRYRLRYVLSGSALQTIEPWLGLGVAFAFRDELDSNYYLWLPLSAGCDFGLGVDGLYGGIAIDVNTINPKGVTRGSADEEHMNNAVVLLRLSYRVL